MRSEFCHTIPHTPRNVGGDLMGYSPLASLLSLNHTGTPPQGLYSSHSLYLCLCQLPTGLIPSRPSDLSLNRIPSMTLSRPSYLILGIVQHPNPPRPGISSFLNQLHHFSFSPHILYTFSLLLCLLFIVLSSFFSNETVSFSGAVNSVWSHWYVTRA